MLVGLIIILLVVFIIAKGTLSSRSDEQQEYKRIQKHQDGSWREENGNGSFSIYSKTGAVTVKRTYDGGERYINGHKVSTEDDMSRWSVMKGLGDGYRDRLSEIEYQLERCNTDDGDALLNEWNTRYQKYRQLCIDYGLWNWVIDDHTSFIPTATQIKRESDKKEQIIKLYEDWKKRMTENRVLFDYLNNCPRKHALKDVLIKDLSGNDTEKKKQIQAVYRRLKKAGTIADKENSEGKIESRIVIRRGGNKTTVIDLPASSYQPALYAHIRKHDVYKADYTVGVPENLNREKNTCQFTSKTSGEKYVTSLEKCTCPAYRKGYACKHMLALAAHLGYFNKHEVRE